MKWINENLYISPINTYIDPSKPVENAIITHGHADHAKPGHKNVLATKETINIMKIRYGENCAENFQELPLNKTLKIFWEVLLFEIFALPSGKLITPKRNLSKTL